MPDTASEGKRFLRWFHAAEGGLAAAFLAVAIGSLATQVVARYGLGAALTWPEELAKLCFVWATFLGAAAGAGQRAHISVDLIRNMLPARLRALLGLLIPAAVVVLLAVLAYHGVKLSILSLNSRLPAIDVPLGYLFLAGPVALGLMVISYSAQTAEAVLALKRGEGSDSGSQDIDPAKVIG